MQTGFEIKDTQIEGIKLITPFYMEDDRGYFLKNYEKDIFEECNLIGDVYEDFETYSRKNVIRGLHFQSKNPQVKIVRAISGSVLDVVVDLRKGSSTFGKWYSFELSDKNHYGLWISAGFAHGFKVLSDSATMSYKCIGKYLKDYDTGIVWDDEDININWEIDNPIVSEKDKQLQSFRTFIEQTGALEV